MIHGQAQWPDIEDQLRRDLNPYLSESNDALHQFIRDGGEPWAIWRIERAFLGRILEEEVVGPI